jgi:hypothetical protein
MPSLSSQLFRGDAALESAATSNPAHIKPGARGRHVEKIQTALNILDDARLTVDGAYGPATASAVLKYKTKRKIINYSYQTAPDNIVGIMTMAKLDEEMRVYEDTPPGRIELIPIRPRENRERAHARVNFKLTADLALVSTPIAKILPSKSITIDIGQTAEIEVRNGRGYHLALATASYLPMQIAEMYAPGVSAPLTSFHIASQETLLIKVKGLKWGSGLLFARFIKGGEVLEDVHRNDGGKCARFSPNCLPPYPNS